jgi:hypothetical protein
VLSDLLFCFSFQFYVSLALLVYLDTVFSLYYFIYHA